MTDDCADAAVVHRVIRLRVEEWRLQNAGREHDLVAARIIISVYGWRRHAPFAAIDRLADLRHLPGALEDFAAQYIHRIRIAIDREQRIIAPFIREPILTVNAASFL